MNGIKKTGVLFLIIFLIKNNFGQIQTIKITDQKNNNLFNNDTICYGPTGEIYLVKITTNGIVFQKSLDKGISFLKEEKIITSIKKSQEKTINAFLKTNGFPSVACDKSKGPNKGRIYVCWCDEKNGKTNKDVYVAYSDDNGERWTDPIIVTYRPNHKEQFMPVMAIDQTTGWVYILYYDRQNDIDNLLTDVYLAVSKNGCQQFEYYKINETSFKQTTFIPNISLSVINSSISPIWKQTNEKKQVDLYTAILNDSILLNYQKKNTTQITLEKMFKFSEEIKIDYSINNDCALSAEITKPLSPGFKKMVVKDILVKKGNNQLIINAKKLGLKKGNYTLTLYYNHKNDYVWITEE